LRAARPTDPQKDYRTRNVHFFLSIHSQSVFLNLLRTLPLFHQPAREHGGGIFLDPKIEKRADLLTEIGGMAETREFITLQRVARSGEKKLPRRLGFAVVHGASR